MDKNAVATLDNVSPQPMGSSAQHELTPELKAEFTAISASDATGLIKPEAVVRRAENPLSPLHKFFTWDDEKAADEWRTMQARYLIRSFRIEVEPTVIVPVFVSLGENRSNGGGYSWYGEVIPEQNLRLNLLLTVLSDMENLLRKIEDLPEVQPLRKAISDTRTKLTPQK